MKLVHNEISLANIDSATRILEVKDLTDCFERVMIMAANLKKDKEL